jgi:hypothetical protein
VLRSLRPALPAGSGPWTSTLPAGGGTHDELRARFAPPPGTHTLTLALRLRNTQFIEDAYHDFMRRLGPGLPKLMRLGSRLPGYRSLLDGLTRRAGLPLLLAVDTGGERREVATILPVGRAAPRDVAIPIPLPSGGGDPHVALRALAGAWEVAALRGTFAPPEQPLSRRWLPPVSAVVGATTSGERATAPELLARTDGRAVELEHGQHLELCFATPVGTARRPGTRTTAVLHLGGHYEPLDESWRPCLRLDALGRCLFTPEPRFASFVRHRLLAGRRDRRPPTGDGGAR